MGKEEIIIKLRELKNMNIPRIRYEDIKKDNNNYTEQQIEEINKQLNNFCKLEDNSICLLCGEKSKFQWEITHGEASCACGWGIRALHYIKDETGKDKLFCRSGFQYHPDCYSVE
jgi:hypothetical protein